MKMINVNNLKIEFDTENGLVRAVNGIGFHLNKGETIGIVGESGSGKSMTALSIMKLVPKIAKVEGQVFFQKKEDSTFNILTANQSKIEQIRGSEIAMIFQEPMTSLNPVFKCGEQISEAIQLHQKISKEAAKKQVYELFEKVKLPDVERMYEAYPHQISGGQKQRVMIAMALSCQPKILIADEPTTALDVTVQKAILELIKDLQEEFQMSVIFISHDLGVIAEIADRVLVMFKGKIVEKGRVEDLFKNPKHPYTKSLLACRPPLDLRLKRLPVMDDFLEINYDENDNFEILEKEKNISKVVDCQRVSDGEVKERFKAISSRKPFLQVQNLKKWFPSKTNFFGKTTQFTKAVNDVSFDVFEGETLGLVGESGCGKTTLGRTILRLIEPTSGEIFYQERDILKIPEKSFRNLRRDFQIIFQDPYSSLNPRQTIGSAIMEPMTFHGLLSDEKRRKEKTIELLELVGLSADQFYRMPHEFSGGQRQRICIARALSTDPKFIICDECVSSLDVSIQAQILNLLIELREKKDLTYIFISHDLSVVKFMSDRMMVMNKGKIEEIGMANDIYRNPKSAYTKRLIEAIPKGL